MIISVKKIFVNTKKDGSGQWWKVLDTNDKSYSVWDASTIAGIAEGEDVDVITETNDKGFTTIKGIVATSGDILFDRAIADAKTGAATVPGVKPEYIAPPATKLQAEISQVIGERMKAMELAIAMVVAGKIEQPGAEEFANKMLSYFREGKVESKPSLVPESLR